MFTNSLIIVSVFFALHESAKILTIFSVPSISHQMVFRPVIEELVNHGHEVTSITTNPIYQQGSTKKPPNLKEIDLHHLSYTVWDHLISNVVTFNNNAIDFLFIMKTAYRVASELFEEQIKNEYIQDLIYNKTVNFDLLITEECFSPSLVFAHIFKVPVIQMSSYGAGPGNMEIIGAATHPFLYPMHYQTKIYNLTIWDKIRQLYDLILFYQMLKNQDFNDNMMLQRIFGNNTPLLNELRNNVQMRFLNVHPIWIHNQPVPPNVVYTWGIHIRPEKSLPKDLQSYLDSSKNGAIYVSFGTNFRTASISSETLKILITVLSRLPYNILWKWDTDELPGKSNNIKISKWFPQSDVLRHPNVKVIITHGGLQSTDEAISAGVPLIGLPIFADQQYNTEKYVHFEIGTKLDFQSLTIESFEEAIKNVFIEYDRYKKNIIQLQTLMNDQPKPPLENAIWWIEYILRHGDAQHLRTPAANMSWAEYYELELILVIFSGLVVLMTVLVILCYYCLKYLSQYRLEINKAKVT